MRKSNSKQDRKVPGKLNPSLKFMVSELLTITSGQLISGDRESVVNGVSIDSRNISKGGLFISFKGERFDGHDFITQAVKNGASCIIYEQRKDKFVRELLRLNKVPKKINLIRVGDGITSLGKIAGYWRNKFNIPVIAVTGSNGKTTTKELIAWVLSKKRKILKNEGTKNNHIGLPLTLLQLDETHELAVVEIGTNHFGEIAYLAKIASPNIAVITNIGESHLEYLKDLKGVFREKSELLKALRLPGVAILNADDKFLAPVIKKKGDKQFVVGVGIDNSADFLATNIEKTSKGLFFRLKNKYNFKLATLGKHNIYNALAAIAVARLFGMGYNDIRLRSGSFEFPKGRLKLIYKNGCAIIDDTYNANPFSLRKALEVLAEFKTSGRKVFIMGDMLELGESNVEFHTQAGKLAAKICDVFITAGKLSELAAESALEESTSTKMQIFSCPSSTKAKEILYSKVRPAAKDVILIKGSRGMKMEEII